MSLRPTFAKQDDHPGQPKPTLTPKSFQLTANQTDFYARKKMMTINQTKRILAPYVKARRKMEETATENKTFSYCVQNKPSILMKEMISQCSIASNLIAVMTETADILGLCTKSTVANVYMVDDFLGEIYILTESFDEASGQHSQHRVSYKIETGKTVAAHVACTREIIKINDLLEDVRFPHGLGNLEVLVKAVLCVPVTSHEGDCLAVFELYRDIDGDPYEDSDLYLVVLMSVWVGSTIHQNQMQLTLQKQHKLTEYLIQLTLCYFDDASLLDKLIGEIVNFAKATLDAEHGFFYVFRNEVGEEVVDEYEDRTHTEKLVKKKNIPVKSFDDTDIINVILQAEGILNIKNCVNDVRLKRQQEKNNYRFRSVLAVPIKMDNQVLGMMQIVNKRKGPLFSKSDEVLLKTFSEYCTLILKFARNANKHKRECNWNKVNEHMLMVEHMKPCIHDTMFLHNHREPNFVPHNFNSFNFTLPESFETYAPQFIIFMFDEIVDRMFESPEKCGEFVLSVRKAFRENCYHNFNRAFHVCHCMYNLLSRCRIFTELESKALLLAAICHGLDDNRHSPTYLELTKHPLSVLYEDGDMIENHYYFVLSLILKIVDGLHHMQEDEYKDLMAEIKVCLLATYRSTLIKRRTKLYNLQNEEAVDLNDKEHRLYLKTVMMGVAIFQDFCKPYSKISARNVQRMYDDNYQDGDLLKELGYLPLNLYNRDKKSCMEHDHSCFITSIVLPNTLILTKIIPSVDQLTREAMYDLEVGGPAKTGQILKQTELLILHLTLFIFYT